MKTDQNETIFEITNVPLSMFSEKNGYLYSNTVIRSPEGKLIYDGYFYRIKLDGTYLTRSKTPFEWRY